VRRLHLDDFAIDDDFRQPIERICSLAMHLNFAAGLELVVADAAVSVLPVEFGIGDVIPDRTGSALM
jgi:hypothetical protein